MAYRIRYSYFVDWAPPGRGLGIEAQEPPGLAGGMAQTLNFQDTVVFGSQTFTAGDITALLASASADISAQMNAQLTRIQGWASGGA